MANFLGAPGQSLIEQDATALTPILGNPTRTTGDVPPCDILFVYANIRPDGSLENSARGLPELMQDSASRIVIVASDNGLKGYVSDDDIKGYVRAAHRPHAHVNLVMTFDRRGEGFATFFVELFSRMRRGVPMTVAWAQLAKPRGGPIALFIADQPIVLGNG